MSGTAPPPGVWACASGRGSSTGSAAAADDEVGNSASMRAWVRWATEAEAGVGARGVSSGSAAPASGMVGSMRAGVATESILCGAAASSPSSNSQSSTSAVSSW